MPDWARRLSAKGAVDFTEALQGTWRRDGEELDRPIELVLKHTATSARRLLESGAMETEGKVSLDGQTFAVRDAPGLVADREVDIDLQSDGFRFIGGLHNLLWKGEPHRLHRDSGQCAGRRRRPPALSGSRGGGARAAQPAAP